MKFAAKRVQQALTGCYADEYRVAYFIGCREHVAALALCNMPGAQIKAGEIKGKYQSFAPKQNTFKYLGFKWKTLK